MPAKRDAKKQAQENHPPKKQTPSLLRLATLPAVLAALIGAMSWSVNRFADLIDSEQVLAYECATRDADKAVNLCTIINTSRGRVFQKLRFYVSTTTRQRTEPPEAKWRAPCIGPPSSVTILAANTAMDRYDVLVARLDPRCVIEITLKTSPGAVVRFAATTESPEAVRVEGLSLATRIALHQREILMSLIFFLWPLLILWYYWWYVRCGRKQS